MSAIVLELVQDPWAICTACADQVDYRTAGRNMPCGCLAVVESVCPTWDGFGCQCSEENKAHEAERAKAEALQAVLEEQEELLRRPGLVMVPGDAQVLKWGDNPAVRVRSVVVLRESVPPAVVPTSGHRFPRAEHLFEKVRWEAVVEPADQVVAQANRWKAALSWSVLLLSLLAISGVWAYGGWPW